MSSPSLLLLSLWLCFLLLFSIQASSSRHSEKRDVYVVYMGAAPQDSSGFSLKESHLQIISSVLERSQNLEKLLVQSYGHGFSGFAARLTKKEATAIRGRADVVSVFLDHMLQLHTTRSWDFLQQTSVYIDSTTPVTDAESSPAASDTIIGVLDTGIWPESPSFSDSGFGTIPTRWKGTCMSGQDFNASNCNKKLIGARHYNTDAQAAISASPTDSPRDTQGHGTHTSSTAAGNAVDASYYGVAAGTAKGGSPRSRIAMYKVCGEVGCPSSAILAGFDDAVADGVDILSVSLGASVTFRPDFAEDPIAIGSFHAVAKGITVVCSAGNDGPQRRSIVNAAPWILTVAATTIDRDFESDVVLGGQNNAIKGEAINFSNLDKSPVYPLFYAGSSGSNSSNSTSASQCEPNSLKESEIKGKIVVCKHLQYDISRTAKILSLKASGAAGAILISDIQRVDATVYIKLPATDISADEAKEILTYIGSTKNPVATIRPTITVTKYKPAPLVAYFSSRGPSAQTANILKPDVAAPGVSILASWPPEEDSSAVPPGQKPTSFKMDSGTSMACPHVSGVAASIKAWNPTWSPSAIRSAIMTTATQTNNLNAELDTDSGSSATPYDCGAGQISPTAALQPGLVYELEKTDYIQFLCNYGYQASSIMKITTVPDGFSCPKNSSLDLISNLNYPSIAVSGFSGKETRTVSRTVTNVGADQAATTYTVSIKSPPGLQVKVVPDKLEFTKSNKKMSYQLIFSASNSTVKGDYFGSVTWSDGTHRVRSPFVVVSD